MNAYDVGAEQLACALDSIMFVFSRRLACDHPNYLSELTQETVIKVSGKIRECSIIFVSETGTLLENKTSVIYDGQCYSCVACYASACTNADLCEQCTIFTFRREKPRFSPWNDARIGSTYLPKMNNYYYVG